MFLKNKSTLLKLLLISLCALNILSFKHRSSQTPETIAPPTVNGNQTNATQPGNMTTPVSNVTTGGQVPPPTSNVTAANQTGMPIPPVSNVTEPTMPVSNITEGVSPYANISEGNITQFPEEQRNISGIKPARIETGALISSEGLPSTTVVNTKEPVISSTGEAIGTIQYDLIKIGAVLEIDTSNKAGESINQNTQKIADVVNSIKQLGISENYILNLGNRFAVKRRKLKSSAMESENVTNVTNATENQIPQNGNKNGNGNQIVSTTQLEIQVTDIAMAAKVIDVLNSAGFKIKYIDYGFQDDTLAFAVNNLIELAMKNALENAKSSLIGTGMQVGQIVNLNVNVDKNFKNHMNSEEGNLQVVKLIKASVKISYTIEKRTTPEETPQLSKRSRTKVGIREQ